LLEECKEAFQEEEKELIQVPMHQTDLDVYVKDITDAITDKFRREAKGEKEVYEEYFQDLTKFIEQKKGQLNELNLAECRKCAQELLLQIFSEFEQQLKEQAKDVNLDQMDQNLKQLEAFYQEQTYDFPEKQLLLAEAKTHFMQDILFFLCQQFQSEIGMQKQLEGQIKERLEDQLREAKEDLKNERDKVGEQLRHTLIEKAELEASNQFLQE